MSPRRTKYKGPIAPMRDHTADESRCNPNTGHKWTGREEACLCGKMTRPIDITDVGASPISKDTILPTDKPKRTN